MNSATRSALAATPVRNASSRSRINTIRKSYIIGQLANVGRAALWWSTFSILTITLLNSDLALAASRGSFNLALLIGAPLAVATAERSAIRTLLVRTTIGRMVLWSMLIPLAWVILNNLWHAKTFLWATLLSLMFLDGVAVAFANAVDIDCGGLDLLSITFSLPITDYVRYRYTTLHQKVFDSCFILLTPPALFLFATISLKYNDKLKAYLPQSIIGDQPSVFVLVVGVGLLFAGLSLLSYYFYRNIPRIASRDPTDSLMVSRSTPLNGSSESITRQESSSIYKQKIGEVLDGLLIVLNNPALKWRLTSLATETALEDVMVSVVIPTMALNASPLLSGYNDIAVAAFMSASLVATGKFGGLLASAWLAGRWNGDSSQKLFNLVLLSSISLIGLPIGYWLISNPSASTPTWVGLLIIGTGVFLFFVLSTGPKIGFASLIQNAVGADDAEATVVFGFIGVFVTITDGLLIIAANLIFYYLGSARTEIALAIVVAAYVLHGVLEFFCGADKIQYKESEPQGGVVEITDDEP